MTKKELLVVLSELDLHPSRRLGQNFMVDANMLDAIVRDAVPVVGEAVLEIGPGLGALTRRLLAAGCRVTAVELDRRLVAYLRRTFADSQGFRLVEGDACRLDLGPLMGEAYRCVSNLPYASSSVILVRLAEADPPPLEIVALLQKEMAARLGAMPGTKEYGALTVNLRLRYEVRVLRAVPPGVFHPPPEIDSVLVRLRYAPAPGGAELHALAVAVARVGFSQRRKKMAGLLAARFGGTAVAEAFGHLGLAAAVRAEEVPVAGFAALAECFRLRGADARPPASPDTGSRRGSRL